MKKIKVVHYINNFFAGVGGEEMAHIEPEIKPGVIGPGISLQNYLGDEYEVVATATVVIVILVKTFQTLNQKLLI